MEKIGIGIIGCGKRIDNLLSKRADGLWNDVNLVALSDVSHERTAIFKQKFNKKAVCYKNYVDLCADPAVDWVIIGLPNALHAEVIIESFKENKNVFCEKPLAVNFAECLKIYKAWLKSNKKFMIGFTLRYSPHYQKINEVIKSGLIGEIISFEFNENILPEHGGHIMSCWRNQRKTTGFHLLEKCCHDIDIANWFAGSRVAKVASFGDLNFFLPKNSYLLEKYQTEDDCPVHCQWPTAKGKNPFTSYKDIVDNQVCIIEYKNGVKATFHTNLNTCINERRMYIAGSEGTIRADAITGVIEVKTLDGKEHDFSTGEKGSHAGGDKILMDSLRNIMRNDDSLAKTGIKDGLYSAITCFALDQANNTESVVRLAPWWDKLDKVKLKRTHKATSDNSKHSKVMEYAV